MNGNRLLAKLGIALVAGLALVAGAGAQQQAAQPVPAQIPPQQALRLIQAVQQLKVQIQAQEAKPEQPDAAAQRIELDPEQIFDGGLFADADVDIVDGHIYLLEPRGGALKEPDPAGDQVLVLTDGSQLHGQLVTLNKNEVIWQRHDAKEPLVFAPPDVKRIVLRTGAAARDPQANATVKLLGSDWLAGELTGLRDGKFQMRIGADTRVEIPRAKADWLQLTPPRTPPPDAYDGPIGPLGLAGWDAADEDNGSWDYADGALVAKVASPISRQFDILPEQLDLQFTAGDGGSNNRGLTLWIQPAGHARGFTKGSYYLRFQAGNVNVNFFNGDQMKTFTANIDEGREEKKVTRYRMLLDRRGGRLILNVNGKQVADWNMPEVKDPSPGGSLSWQPSYWSSNMAWTLSNVSVRPWDGQATPDAADEEKGKDLLKAAGAPRLAGPLEDITAESVKFAGKDIPRKDPIFLRLHPPENPDPGTGGIARVWLAARGEFDVSGIGFHDGELKVRTSFADEISLPAASVRAIEFPHKQGPPPAAPQVEGGDTLIFRNGDQLRGTLLAAGHDQPLRWKPIKGDKPVEFAPDRLAGVLLATRKEVPPGGNGAAVYFQNGDWLSGRLLGLDKDSLRLSTALAGELHITRGALRTVYFAPVDETGAVGEAPVWDGASQRDLWMRGATVSNYWGGSGRARDTKKNSPWRYLDGSFTLLSSGSRNGSANGINLGRTLDNLPDKVDVSFDLSTTKGGANYAIQLFFDDNKPGIMVQGSWDNAYLYDMSPRRNAGIVFNQPQQLDFGEKVGSDGNRRHFRFLGDRTTGRLWMYVNGILVGELNHRSGADNPKEGKGIAILPQPVQSRVTVSNLWIAPWSGALPEAPKAAKDDDKKAAAKKEDDPKDPGDKAKDPKETPVVPSAPSLTEGHDAIALSNGDETLGLVESATANELHVKCDVGDLQIPLKRAVMVEFGGKGASREPGVRLRLAGKGALTVQAFHLADGQIVCHSSSAGDLKFPLEALSEIVFQPSDNRPFESLPISEASDEEEDGIFLDNGVRVRIQVR